MLSLIQLAEIMGLDVRQCLSPSNYEQLCMNSKNMVQSLPSPSSKDLHLLPPRAS